MRRSVYAALCLLSSVPAQAELATKLLSNEFERPVWAGAPASAPDRLWVMEQAGTVWIVDLASGTKSATPFLQINEQVSRRGNEEGLLGLAFCPHFEETGRYYVNFTDHEQHTRIVRFVSHDRRTTDPATGELLLRFQQDFNNHNGGWLDFGPDGMLYIATGDGGAADDPKNRAQDPQSLLGKLLRIDVSVDKGYAIPRDNPWQGKGSRPPEIVALGLRNPWRCSFDRKTGDLWIADVGQNAWEEINFVPKGQWMKANFGWRLREGDVATPNDKVGGHKPQRHHDPIYVYDHGSGPTQGLSVTGGFVYRGTAIPNFQGRYVFADYQNPRIWSFVARGSKATDFRDHTSELQPPGGRINLVASFAEDASGELYLLDHTGPIYRIVGAQ